MEGEEGASDTDKSLKIPQYEFPLASLFAKINAISFIFVE
jgi:hypothetical protein